MLRRGFDPWHVSHAATPPHPGYDAVIGVLAAIGSMTGRIYALTGKRGTGKTQAATRIALDHLTAGLERQATAQAQRYAIIARAGEKNRTTTKEEWEICKSLQVKIFPEEQWPLCTTARNFFLAIKESWEAGKESWVVEKYLKADVLVIDEAHVRSDSKWEDDQLSDLIDRRCYRNRDTIIISNLDKQALAAALGASIVSRIHERGGFLECNWPSFRQP